MNRTPVTSSNIKSIGYHEGTLEVAFNSGRVYQYLDVSPATHLALTTAESIGKFFSEHVRDRYETHEVAAEALPDFDALIAGITAWQDEAKCGVYFDHAQRLYALGITDVEMLRALLTTLYQTAVANEGATRRAIDNVIRGDDADTLQERINYRPGGA